MPGLRSAALALLLAVPPAPAADRNPAPAADRNPAPAADRNPAPRQAVVASVYDGDTLTLSTGQKVRLRLVNTPELKPREAFGVEARDAARALVLGRTVELEYGETRVDGYGRLLASVRVGDEDLATHLVGLGYGHIFVIPPDHSDLRSLVAAQERVRAGHIGIWSTERFKGDLHITSFHANARGDDRTNLNGESIRLCNVARDPVDLDGYRIGDLSGGSWVLPALIVPPGHTVLIHSGTGTNRIDPRRQLEVFLGSTEPIWNNQRDRATITDPAGRVVDSRLHEVKG